jgi:hypothetical protein
MAPPLLVEEEGPQPKKLNLRAIRTISLPHYGRRGQVGFCHLSARPESLLDPGQARASRSFQYRVDFTKCCGLRKRRHLPFGMTGHDHRPHTCLAVGTRVQESIPSMPDIATLPRVHSYITMVTLTSDKHALVKACFSI